MFWRRSRALSKETLASSPTRLRSSSARRSLVCAPLTEGERTDADASCWRRDDRGLDLVEVECAMPSSRSTSSRHCFMAPGEAMELGGCRSNSLAAEMLPESPSTESRMSVEPYAATRRAQQRRPAQGGWEPVVWKKQLLPPPRNPTKSRRSAQRFAPSC
jgi:hypothetical protein